MSSCRININTTSFRRYVPTRAVLLLMEMLLANNVDPDQMPHYVAFDLGLHCLPMTVLRILGKNGLR